MADLYIVTAAAAVVKPVGAPETYRYRGDIVPADAENLDHLVDTGLVDVLDGVAEPDPTPDPEDDGGAGQDLDAMTLEDLRAYAKERDINLEGATKKDEVLAKIRAAQA